MRIVVIEDEIRIREGLEKLIEKLDKDYQVVGTAENGQEGLELVRRIKPDVIVTDIKMPLTDGLEMLEILYQEGYEGKAVMLSAYSEFDYARRAMRLGVKEYLLKPVAVNEVSQCLGRIGEEIQRESIQSRFAIKEAAQAFSGILWGSLEGDSEMEELLEKQYGIPKNTRYAELCFYLGEDYEKNRDTLCREAERILSSSGGLKWECLLAPESGVILFLIYGYKDIQGLQRFVQWEILHQKEKRAFDGAGWNGNLLLLELREGFLQIEKYMEWNISLGDDVLIAFPKITRLQTGACIYPLDIEGKMKMHLCANDRDGLEKDMEEFREFFQKGALYAPKEIKECYVRFLWAMINVAKETGMLDFENLEQQSLLEHIMSAKTRYELKKAAALLTERLGEKETEEAVHLTVKRAQGLIHEFYRTGITLEEIASRLNITPEYLGTRFRKELGVNFSTYIKNYRIGKAKEMLIGTQMKLYEIAERTGYSDAKYFSRVFKEATGQLPADYRKTHK